MIEGIPEDGWSVSNVSEESDEAHRYWSLTGLLDIHCRSVGCEAGKGDRDHLGEACDSRPQ